MKNNKPRKLVCKGHNLMIAKSIPFQTLINAWKIGLKRKGYTN